MKKFLYWFACLMMFIIMPVSALAANTPIYVGNLTEDYDTYWQAVGVDYMADEILESLQIDGLSDTQKIRKVYDWVIENCNRKDVSYGISVTRNPFYVSYSAYSCDYIYEHINLNQAEVDNELADYAMKLQTDYKNGKAAMYNCGPKIADKYNSWDSADSINDMAKYIALYHEGDCIHFSSLFAILMDHLGYETHLVNGEFINNDGTRSAHTWNYALIDGQYYYFDVRMDHANYKRTGKLNHNYFMVSDEETWSKKHEWDKSYTWAIRDGHNKGEQFISFVDDNYDGYRGLGFYSYNSNKRIANTSGVVIIYIKNDKIYVPLRFISELFHANMNWSDNRILLKFNDVNLTFDLNNKTVVKNGTMLALSDLPFVKDDTTYVPLCFVVDCLGTGLRYEGSSIFINNGEHEIELNINGRSAGAILLEGF